MTVLPASHPSSPRPACWLDSFPTEVCEKIVAHVAGPWQFSCLHRLAAISPKQQAAVLSVLSYRLCSIYYDTSLEDAHFAWTQIFKLRVRELVLCTHQRGNPPSKLAKLLMAPTLQKASIPSTPSFLQDLSQANSVRAVELYLENETKWKLIFAALDSIDIRELRLLCSATVEEHCKIAETMREEGVNVLSARYPSLTTLGIKCRCLLTVAEGEDPRQQWTILRDFKSLRKISISFDVPDEGLPVLKALESVEVFDVESPCSLAGRIGAPVTAMVNWVHGGCPQSGINWCTVDDIALLAPCSRFSALALRLCDDAEAALPSIGMDLECLSMTWMRDDKRPYYEPMPGSMRHLVRSFPNLRELDLVHARIAGDEFCAILEFLGTHLESLGLSVCRQDVPPIAYLIEVPKTLTDGCQSLRKFELIDVYWFHPKEPLVDTEIEDAVHKHLLMALGRFRRAMPPCKFVHTDADSGMGELLRRCCDELDNWPR